MDTENSSQLKNLGSHGSVKDLKIATVCITRGGLQLAKKLSAFFPGMNVYAYGTYKKVPDGPEGFSSLSELVNSIWHEFRAFLFIMAAGIVMRTIAPLIQDKRKDPAVLVLDERGKFVVSLLSGHIGMANSLTIQVAQLLGGQAVVTTASDVLDKLSLDLWALERNLYVEDWERLKKLSACIINGDEIRVFSDGFSYELPRELTPVHSPEEAQLIISNRIMDIPALYLRPKNLALGIGCNRGTQAEEIEEAVKGILKEKGFSFSAIRNIATVDIKRDEKGLLAFAKMYGLAIEFFSVKELNEVRGIQESQAPMNAIGAQGVAEPSALLSIKGQSTLVVPKQKRGNITLALASFL